MWVTTELSSAFGLPPIIIEDDDTDHTPFSGPIVGYKTGPHTEETKKKMSEAAKGRDMTKAIEAARIKNTGRPSWNKGLKNPSSWVSGKLYHPEHGVVEFESVRYFSIEYGLRQASVSRVVSGTRKSYKGWRRA
jgi:hypothetical protein